MRETNYKFGSLSSISCTCCKMLLIFILFFCQVTVYQCLEGGVIAVLQSYIDEDVSKDSHHSAIVQMD